jgi:hypothetical protein
VIAMKHDPGLISRLAQEVASAFDEDEKLYGLLDEIESEHGAGMLVLTLRCLCREIMLAENSGQATVLDFPRRPQQ